MTSIDTFISAKSRLTIELNGLHITPMAVPESLRRFIRPLAFLNKKTDFQLSFSGTCLLFRSRARNLLICCSHQVTNAGRKPEEIVIVADKSDGRPVGINPDEAAQGRLDPSEGMSLADVADVLIAEFPATMPDGNLASNFLRFDIAEAPDLRSVSEDEVSAIFAIGYPTADTFYDSEVDDDGNVISVDILKQWVLLYLRREAPSEWDAPGLMPLGPANGFTDILAEPDGISGAPVFFIYGLHTGRPGLGFAGMVVRADKQGRINLIEAGQIHQILEQVGSEATPLTASSDL